MQAQDLFMLEVILVIDNRFVEDEMTKLMFPILKMKPHKHRNSTAFLNIKVIM